MTTKNQHETIESVIVARALKDEAFKQQLLSNSATAKAAIEQELAEQLPEDFSVNVVEETPNTAYIVLPYMPSTEGLTEKQLESVAGGISPITLVTTIRTVAAAGRRGGAARNVNGTRDRRKH